MKLPFKFAGMSKIVVPLALVLLAMMFLNSSCAKVEPGYVGIRVNMYGSQRGVEDFPIKTGRVWYNPITEDVYKFPTFLQTRVWSANPHEGKRHDESITFNSAEGVGINADIAISYAFLPEKVPYLFVEFRQDAEHITDVYVFSQLRDALNTMGGQYKVMDILGDKKHELLTRVKQELTNTIGTKGIRIDMVSFTGRPRVDQRVEAAINSVIEAMQRAAEAQQKVRQAQAEAEQKVKTAEGEAKSIMLRAEAQAKANKLVAESVTPALVQWESLQRWNGIMPQVTGGAIPFISLPTGKP
jgi:regulator of protease activity HflC (stomatin/prohibitin superfamily)